MENAEGSTEGSQYIGQYIGQQYMRIGSWPVGVVYSAGKCESQPGRPLCDTLTGNCLAGAIWCISPGSTFASLIFAGIS